MALDVFIYPASFKPRQKVKADRKRSLLDLNLDLNLLFRLALIYLFHSNLSNYEHLRCQS
ncbi:MAG: hypothetical protein A2170_03220 [Deltaproteobacteria bacterium RBG_13_53_10]|nr:MAG: hypothetical protein A2170_03220 [Deltaproteobacteria bacterium RBG_13_53_10]